MPVWKYADLEEIQVNLEGAREVRKKIPNVQNPYDEDFELICLVPNRREF